VTGLALLAAAGLALAFAAVACAGWAIAADAEAWPARWLRRYVAWLDAALGRLFLPARGRWIWRGQALALEAVALGCLWSGQVLPCLAAVPALVGPAAWLRHQRRRRLRLVETQVDTFLLTLANALRATPSLGRALSDAQRLVPAPLGQELGRCLAEQRVGSSVDAALRDMGRRVGSDALDAALLAVLIGRRVGGELTRVLETTAATLREMARLRGVLRAKTAEARAQLWVLGLAPALVWYGFDAVKPGYFAPLQASAVGWVLSSLVLLLWAGSLLLARRVLAVKL
jgi:tight adherence protein B